MITVAMVLKFWSKPARVDNQKLNLSIDKEIDQPSVVITCLCKRIRSISHDVKDATI